MTIRLNEYQSVLLILDSEITSAKKHDQLLKAQLSTQDAHLKTLLMDCVRVYRLYIKSGMSRQSLPRNYNEWLAMLKPVKKDLQTYCAEKAEDPDPDWMIKAKANGWAPIKPHLVILERHLNNLQIQGTSENAETVAKLLNAIIKEMRSKL